MPILWVPLKKNPLCGMSNKQNTCSYKLLKAFSSTQKDESWLQLPYVTRLVKEVAVQICVRGTQE